MEMLAVYVNESADGVEKSIREQLRIQMILCRVSGDIWMRMRSLRFVRCVAWLISTSICAHNLHLFRSSFFFYGIVVLRALGVPANYTQKLAC